MISDIETKTNGMKALVDNLGMIETKRFIDIMQREPFDYIKWRKNLSQGETLESMNLKAMEYRRKFKQNHIETNN